MKGILFFLLFAASVNAGAQTLKDALFSGKLKTDTGTVLKKGDSLKILKNVPQKGPMDKKDSVKIETLAFDSVKIIPHDTVAKTPVVITAADNNKIWKQFVDQYIPIINSEVLPSKKIKKDTYYVLIEYEIGLDGTISTTNISCTPENSYLVDQIKTRMMGNAPQLAPVMMSNGKPKKVNKKQMLTFTKEK